MDGTYQMPQDVVENPAFKYFRGRGCDANLIWKLMYDGKITASFTKRIENRWSWQGWVQNCCGCCCCLPVHDVIYMKEVISPNYGEVKMRQSPQQNALYLNNFPNILAAELLHEFSIHPNPSIDCRERSALVESITYIGRHLTCVDPLTPKIQFFEYSVKSEAIQDLKRNDIPNAVYVVLWLNHEGLLGMATNYTIPKDIWRTLLTNTSQNTSNFSISWFSRI